MAEDDEIDIIGDFSFNSCFAQNSQGIPSCSDREDTVHPQWLLDSTANNWYDVDDKNSNRRPEGPSRKLSGYNSKTRHESAHHTIWSDSEKNILMKLMSKYGRDIDKIALILKSKTKAEIQALIEAEHGVILDTPPLGLVKTEEVDVPPVVQEEIVSDAGTVENINNIIHMVKTGVPTIPVVKKMEKNKFDTSNDLESNIMVNPSEILYEDDLIVASTEFITSEKVDVAKSNKKGNRKVVKKMGNHRRKGHNDRVNIKSKNKQVLKSPIKSPPGRQRNDSIKSDDSTKNPKMHIVLGSGQALPVSEGEEVIKIEKKKESDCESDIEIDVDSDKEESVPEKSVVQSSKIDEDKKTVPTRKFEPMPKRNKKINLDGGGGYTIMHTESGDMYEIGREPRKERQPKKPAIQLYPCRVYNDEKPAPFSILLHVSALIAMDAHAHTSRAEVGGLLGGDWCPPRLLVRRYRRVRAAAHRTHCDMDPVSQAAAAEWLVARGCYVCGWHHSHPAFPAAPSALDLRTQRALQALPATAPPAALVTSQHWPPGRAATHYRCFRVEDDEVDGMVGYQLRVKLVGDLCGRSLPAFLRELRTLLTDHDDDHDPYTDGDHAGHDPLRVNMVADVCPQAGLTYIDKLISSVSHHMRSAGYEEHDPLVEQLVQGIRDIFR